MSYFASDNPKESNYESRSVAILAPTPQDAKYCDEILRGHGMAVEILTSIREMTRRIHAGTGVLLISQEFLTADGLDQIRTATDAQPSWSDTPIVVLLARSETPVRILADLLSLGNVTLLERPLSIALLVSTLKARLRDRARQYEVKELLHKAQEASRAKSAFVANISHEIRTPMTSILGYAELMSNLIDNEEALGYLSTIRRNGDFLLGMINDILDLSKIEADKLEIDREWIDPCQVVEDVRSVMDVRASEKGLRLEVEYDKETPRCIESDSKRLRQILINLVGNAIKFTAEGSVRVLVSFTYTSISQDAEQDPVGILNFDIVDSGIGMTTDQRERLFKPFSQGDSLITQQFGGTGLGLAISQRLARMLNGEISIESALDHGSTFTLRMVIGQTNDKSHSHSTASSSPSNTLTAPEVQLRAHILIVDDRRDIRFLSNRIVTMAGGQVTEAEDGVQAIEAVHHASANGNQFDAILLDMRMPNMDGYETASKLRKMGYQNPIIALSADAMPSDVAQCIRAGCDHHIRKPINKKELLQLLLQVTSGH